MRLASSASALIAAALLAGCGAGSTTPSPHEQRSRNGLDAAQPAVTTPAAKSPHKVAAENKPLRYTYPIHRCSSSPSSSHHDYPASDIFTQRGCRFVAVTRGTVDEVTFHDHWKPSVDAGSTRGGLSVSIVGDDGVRYYGSHLLRIAPGIKPGARVHTGDVLGRVDNSGDAKYTPTHVHFGLSWPTKAGKWWVRRGEVWPQRFLTAWRDGEDLSPARAVRRAHKRIGNVPRCTVLC